MSEHTQPNLVKKFTRSGHTGYPGQKNMVILLCHEINSHKNIKLIGRSYKNDEFDWLFDLVTVT